MYQLVPSLPASISVFWISLMRANEIVGIFAVRASKAFFPMKIASWWCRKVPLPSMTQA